MRCVVVAACLLFAACGGASTSASGAGTTPASADTRPVAELTIHDPRAGFVHVGDLRGQVVIIVFVTTFDTMSQVQLTELGRFAALHPEVAFVGVLVQQGADDLADAYVRALDPGFPMGYDPDGTLAAGTTAFGAITTVPTLVALDRAGHVVARREGYQQERTLEAMLLEADVRVPEGQVTPPPLLGDPNAAR